MEHFRVLGAVREGLSNGTGNIFRAVTVMETFLCGGGGGGGENGTFMGGVGWGR